MSDQIKIGIRDRDGNFIDTSNPFEPLKVSKIDQIKKCECICHGVPKERGTVLASCEHCKPDPLTEEVEPDEHVQTFNIVKFDEPNPSASVVPDTSKVTRLEVIDHTLPIEDGGGRCYTKRGDIKVELDVQDFGATLKVFITKR